MNAIPGAFWRAIARRALLHWPTGIEAARPRNAGSDDELAAVVQLASTTYAGSNHTHLTELLREPEGIDLGRQTVHRILTSVGFPCPRKRHLPRQRVRRQRMEITKVILRCSL